MQRTPLHDWHVRAGARMIGFAGWEMPLQYTGIIEEHLAVREAVGLFDVSHMGKIWIRGDSVASRLGRLSANDVPTRAGRARYTHLLREDGTILDDVILTCVSEDAYLVVCNAGPRETCLEWFRAHLPKRDTVLDATMDMLCLALQGPRAPEVLASLTTANVESMKSFDAAALPFSGRPSAAAPPVEAEGWGTTLGRGGSGGAPSILVTRTGYTGEAGFELFPPAGEAEPMWSAILEAGRPYGIRPIGLGARDTLRLEKGYLLSGQDFDGRQTPLEVNCSWLVRWDHEFLGKQRLAAQRAGGDHRRLVGLRILDKSIPRHGHRVTAQGREIGTVTSGTMSPSLRVGIALASVDSREASPGTDVSVDIRESPHPARVVPLPFL